jgi:hypothetical protein
MVSDMKKTINFFSYYTAGEVFKALVVLAFFIVVPTISISVLLVNLSLVMLPYYPWIIAILAIAIVGIIGYGWHIFIETLKHYKNIELINYRLIFYIAFGITSAIALTFVIGLGFTIF